MQALEDGRHIEASKKEVEKESIESERFRQSSVIADGSLPPRNNEKCA
jgi:hypothetical protein